MLEERFQRVWDKFDYIAKLAEERMAAQAVALLKAEQSLADYKEASNGSRGAMSDLVARLLPRSEYDTQHAALAEKVSGLDSRVLQNTAAQTGRETGITKVGTIVVSVIGALMAFASVTSLVFTLLHSPAEAVDANTRKLDQLIESITRFQAQIKP